MIRGGKVPLPNISNSKNIASSCEPDRGVNSTLLPQVDNTSVQTDPELSDAICQTFVKPTKFVVNPFSVDDCAEVVGSSFTSTKYTQTVSTIRKTSLEKIVSNPHPDIVQEALSKKKEKKHQLSQIQKAIRWANSDKKEALQKYKSVNPIELPCETHQVCSKSFFS